MSINSTESEYTTIVYIDHLDEKTTSELDQIVNQKTEDHEKGFLDSIFDKNSKNVCVTVTKKMSETTKKIISIAKPFFENAGLDVNENKGYISYISYEWNSAKYIPYDNTVENVNCANEGFAGCHQCIIVTKKSENLKNGNMEVYNKNPHTFFNLIGYEEDDTEIYKLETGTVIVLNGDAIHKLQSFSGNGVFNFIEVILYENKYNEEDQ